MLKSYQQFLIKEKYDNYLISGDYFKTRKHADEYGMKMFQNWYNNLTNSEKDIIEWWRDSGYRETANLLYGEKEIFEDDLSENDIKSNLEQLKAILNKSENSSDLITYKGLRQGKLLNIIKNLKMNNTLNFEGFVSTSLHYFYATTFGTYGNNKDDVNVMKINIPKGTSCAFISFDLTECELLLNSNLTFKLINIYDVPDKIHNKVKIFEFDII